MSPCSPPLGDLGPNSLGRLDIARRRAIHHALGERRDGGEGLSAGVDQLGVDVLRTPVDGQPGSIGVAELLAFSTLIPLTETPRYP